MADVMKIEPAQFVDKLRERIRSSLGELIPEEQWNAMLRAEIERFFAERVERGYYSGSERRIPSDFTFVAQETLAAEARKRIGAYFERDAWAQRWEGGNADIPARLEQLVQENLPGLMRECVLVLLGRIASRSSEAIEDAMRRSRQS